MYLEDNAYLGDLVNPNTGSNYQFGVDFDLNEYNVRWCVTPEFPGGTWAYFCTINADGTPAFPYALGRQYWGTPDTANVTAIPVGATNYFRGGTNAPTVVSRPAKSGNNVVLTWSSLEGGVYRVEASTNLTGSNWVAFNTNVVATGMVANVTQTNGALVSPQFFRVIRTGIGGTTTTTNSAVNVASSPNTSARGVNNLSVTFTILATTPPLPPANIVPTAVTIGSISANASTISRLNTTNVMATFNIPANAATGAQNVVITFPTPQGTATYTETGGFTIN
jgi:hypothetical protein